MDDLVSGNIHCFGYLDRCPVRKPHDFTIEAVDIYSLQISALIRRTPNRIRLRKPSFSIEAFAKVICDLYMIPFRRRYRTGLADAFDAYLLILRRIDKQVLQALGRDTPNWRVLNACPPCGYEVVTFSG